MYIFFISPFFVLIYTAVEMNKNMIKTRTYKNTSQKLNGENWSRRGGNSLFQGVFQNMNRCSIWWLFGPRVCNGVGIIVAKNWIESLLTVPIWDRKTFATERDRKCPHAGYACPLGRNSPSLVTYSYMRLDNQRQVQRGRRVPDAPKYIRQSRWFL